MCMFSCVISPTVLYPVYIVSPKHRHAHQAAFACQCVPSYILHKHPPLHHNRAESHPCIKAQLWCSVYRQFCLLILCLCPGFSRSIHLEQRLLIPGFGLTLNPNEIQGRDVACLLGIPKTGPGFHILLKWSHSFRNVPDVWRGRSIVFHCLCLCFQSGPGLGDWWLSADRMLTRLMGRAWMRMDVSGIGSAATWWNEIVFSSVPPPPPASGPRECSVRIDWGYSGDV